MPIATHAIELTTPEYGYVGVLGFYVSHYRVSDCVTDVSPMNTDERALRLSRAVTWLREAHYAVLQSCWMVGAIDPRSGNRSSDTDARRVLLKSLDQHATLLSLVNTWWQGAAMVNAL